MLATLFKKKIRPVFFCEFYKFLRKPSDRAPTGKSLFLQYFIPLIRNILLERRREKNQRTRYFEANTLNPFWYFCFVLGDCFLCFWLVLIQLIFLPFDAETQRFTGLTFTIIRSYHKQCRSNWGARAPPSNCFRYFLSLNKQMV